MGMDDLRVWVWVWLKAVQPIKEFHPHIHSDLLVGLHCITPIRPSFLHIWVILEREVPLLKRGGVVEEKLRSAFEHIWNIVLAEILVKWARDIGEHDGNVVGERFGEDSG